MIVVTGATGNVGAAATEALLKAGERVTAVSRRPAAPPDGVQHVSADLTDPSSLDAALTEADSIFVVLPPDLQIPGARPVDVIHRIASSGVKRIVLLTTLGAKSRPNGPTRVVVRTAEEALRATDLDWTILRPGGFMSNAFAWVESVRALKTVSAPFGDIAIPIIDPLDIGAVAAACLLEDKHSGSVYELTGPELITPRRQTRVIADSLGQPIAFREITRDEARTMMIHAVPAELADDTLDIIGAPNPAEQRVSPDVEAVLGRPPHSFTEWVDRNIAAFG